MVKIYMNGFRRWLVKKLLGTDLIVEKRDTPDGFEWQLIDLKRRIPYGWFRVEKMNRRDFKINESYSKNKYGI